MQCSENEILFKKKNVDCNTGLNNSISCCVFHCHGYEQWAMFDELAGNRTCLKSPLRCFSALGGVQGGLGGIYLGASPGGAEGESGDDIGIQTVNSSEWKHTHTRTEHRGTQKEMETIVFYLVCFSIQPVHKSGHLSG